MTINKKDTFKPNRFALIPKQCTFCGKYFMLEKYRKSFYKEIICLDCIEFHKETSDEVVWTHFYTKDGRI